MSGDDKPARFDSLVEAVAVIIEHEAKRREAEAPPERPEEPRWPVLKLPRDGGADER